MTEEELKFEREKWQSQNEREIERFKFEMDKLRTETLGSKDNKGLWGQVLSATSSPVLLAVIGVIGAGVGAVMQGYTAVRAEREKLRSTLILKAIDTNNQTDALRFLQLLRDTKLVTDISVAVENYEKNPEQIPLRKDIRADGDRDVALNAVAIDSIRWFIENFSDEATAALANTPFTPELLAAIAYAETGSLWPRIREGKLELRQTLALCVGDTLDAPMRSAWPQTKADLISAEKGNEMFSIAREALENLVVYEPSLRGLQNKPDKFCHSFGIFACDIQFFRTNPEFFLLKKWQNFDDCVRLVVEELNGALKRQDWQAKKVLTDEEMTFVAIAYTRGRADPSKGMKQGFRDTEGLYYGERIHQYLLAAKSVSKH